MTQTESRLITGGTKGSSNRWNFLRRRSKPLACGEVVVILEQSPRRTRSRGGWQDSLMVKKSEGLERGVFESERNFRLLAGGVVDYAICMLDPTDMSSTGTRAPNASRATGRGILGKHFSLFYLPRTAHPAILDGTCRPPARPSIPRPRAGASARTARKSTCPR